MAKIDLRECINAVSDVVNNRPQPLREFDQIFMKTTDMLLQAEHVGKYFDNKRVIFIGDGDAIGLCLLHLHNQRLVEKGPASVHVLDFDERIVLSIRKFANDFGIADRITSELYNVVDPLPREHWHVFGGFYTNPPFGASNTGKSIEAFLMRGSEAVGQDGVACIVLPDHHDYPWTQEILRNTERWIINNDFVISEVLPEFHHYHLDDAPSLTSCSLVAKRRAFKESGYNSAALDSTFRDNFYGEEAPLRIKYVRDLTNGGKLPSRDHRMEPI